MQDYFFEEKMSQKMLETYLQSGFVFVPAAYHEEHQYAH